MAFFIYLKSRALKVTFIGGDYRDGDKGRLSMGHIESGEQYKALCGAEIKVDDFLSIKYGETKIEGKSATNYVFPIRRSQRIPNIPICSTCTDLFKESNDPEAIKWRRWAQGVADPLPCDNEIVSFR